MITTIARLILALAVIIGVIRLLQLLRPKPTYFVAFLDYPRKKHLERVEYGELVNLWPNPERNAIYVYRRGMSEKDGLLGQLPGKYFQAVESVLRKGEPYEAVVVDHTGHNIQLEVKLKVREIPDELV